MKILEREYLRRENNCNKLVKVFFDKLINLVNDVLLYEEILVNCTD